MKIQLSLYYCLAALLLLPFGSQAQKKEKNLVQLSGVIKSESNNPVPFATVKIKNTFRGTIAGVDGFYSLVVGERDTIIYEALGHKPYQFIVPDNISDQKLTNNIVMKSDTITYEETYVYPWPTKEEFRQAFLSLQKNDTYADLAKKNLDQQKLQELYENMARDGQEQQLRTLQALANSYYYAGGQTNYMMMGGGVPIPTSLLNPFAWSQFIKDLKAGKFKNKHNNDNNNSTRY
jgi:ABC-type antimicrobial peptide transport system permease subunit